MIKNCKQTLLERQFLSLITFIGCVCRNFERFYYGM